MILTGTVPASTSGFTYVVERRSGDDDEAEYQPLGRTTRTSLTDNAVTPGLYDYRITAVSSEADSVSSLPQTLFLEVDGNVFVSGPNPNPTTRFTQNTRIDITVDRSQNVSVSMYNMLGQRVYQENLRLDDNVATAIQFRSDNCPVAFISFVFRVAFRNYPKDGCYTIDRPCPA